jgi:phosphoglycerate dehydrogenase-like enzyme
VAEVRRTVRGVEQITRVVVLDDYQQVASSYAPWERLGVDVDFVAEHLTDDDLVARIGGAEVVVAMRERTPFDAATLARLPALRLLVTTGPNNASIDVGAARERGVVVCGTGSQPGSTAELTWALIIAVLRRLPEADADMRSGAWQQVLPGLDLAGSTLGVLGLGRLGQRVARVGLAFEMEVLAWSQNLDPDLATGLGVQPVSKEQLLERSDVVSVHLKLSDRTRGLLGRDELARMKPRAVLVNTSRGPIIDEAALVDALQSGRLGGAGLDVYDVEPLPVDHPLRTLPNTVLTPHIGYVTEGTYRVFFEEALEDVVAWRDGAPIRVVEP